MYDCSIARLTDEKSAAEWQVLDEPPTVVKSSPEGSSDPEVKLIHSVDTISRPSLLGQDECRCCSSRL